MVEAYPTSAKKTRGGIMAKTMGRPVAMPAADNVVAETRRKLYHSLEELQTDLDAWMDNYNTQRTHQGKMCCGRTPMQTLLDGKRLWREKVGQLN